MAHPKAMGLGAMLIFLVLSVALLPVIVRYINRLETDYVISGFEDLHAAALSESNNGDVHNIPHVKVSPSYIPDKNTNYLCSKACPEGTRCDGVLDQCVSLTVPATTEPVGYFS